MMVMKRMSIGPPTASSTYLQCKGVENIELLHHFQWRIKDFPWGCPSHTAPTPNMVHFERFVCPLERIGNLVSVAP